MNTRLVLTIMDSFMAFQMLPTLPRTRFELGHAFCQQWEKVGFFLSNSNFNQVAAHQLGRESARIFGNEDDGLTIR